MHELYDLKEKLCDELKEYSRKGVNAGNLDVVDKLAHAVKNLDKIIEVYDGEEYSERYYPGSYARKRDSMGRYSRRGYSRNSFAEKLRDLMEDAPDEKSREEIRRLADKM